ncbi:MAG: L-threonylcarbamoyladenylate synthase [Bacteroidota bacterium]
MQNPGRRIDLDTAVILLREGKVVALPTETVYGLGCRASDPAAIAEVYRIKQRPVDNPLICHVSSPQMMFRYVTAPAPWLIHLLGAFAPGPISFLLPLNAGAGQSLRAATGGRPGVVMRLPAHPLTQKIIRELDAPIAAPSANTSGKVSPTTAQMVIDDLGEKIAGVLDGGDCRVGIESTILDVREAHRVRILRPGTIGEADLRMVLAHRFPGIEVAAEASAGEVVPGSKYTHYAPETPVYWIEKAEVDRYAHRTDGVLVGLSEDLPAEGRAIRVDLGSLRTSPERVAYALYRNIKSLDTLPVERAWLIRFDPGKESIARAVMNRLEKVARTSSPS